MKRYLIIVLASLVVMTLANVAGVKFAMAEYPEKPIHFIIPIGAGSTGDLYLRQMLPKVSEVLGQKVVVVNKGGGAGIPGYKEIHDAKPDGYTIGLAMVNIMTHKPQGLFPYDYTDYTLFGTVYNTAICVLGTNKTEKNLKNIQDVLSFAKAHPNELSLGVASKGYVTWIASQAFIKASGLDFNVVTHEGGGQLSIPELAGGHLDLAVLSLSSSVKSQIAANNIRLLAIIGNNRLTGEFSDIPTLPEIGIDAVMDGIGLAIGPPKIPENIKNKLVPAIKIGATAPAYREFLKSENVSVDFYIPPSELPAYLDKRTAVIKKIMKEAGIIK